jgi:hypothetical protein
MTDNHDPLGPLGDAFLRSQSQSHREALSDLSAQEINNLSMSEYAMLTGRENPATAAYRNLYDEPARPVPTHAVSPVPVAPAPVSGAPQGRPFEELANDGGEQGFLAWRSQRGNQGEGRGLFDSVGSQSDAYRAASAQHAGRTGYRQGSSAGAELMARRGRTIVKQNEIPPSGRRTFGY